MQTVKRGAAVLFLGSGASTNATANDGGTLPNSSALAASIANRFLDGRNRDKPLSVVAELVLATTPKTELDQYVSQLFAGATPTRAHHNMAEYRWRSIFTTNYDDLIERAYEKAGGLKLSCHTNDQTRPTFINVPTAAISLYKLHGCINAIHSSPLVLSREEGWNHKNGRHSLFTTFESESTTYPVIFVGYSLNDDNVLRILSALPEGQRIRHYVVDPQIDEDGQRAFDKKLVTTIRMTFDQFMLALHSEIPKRDRALAQALLPVSHPITNHFVSNAQVSFELGEALQSDIAYLGSIPATPMTAVKNFFEGSAPEFAGVAGGWVFDRDRMQEVLSAIYLVPSLAASTTAVLVSGAAGCGKSVFLQSCARYLGETLNCLVLYSRAGRPLPVLEVYEVLAATNEPIYLLIDDAARKLPALSEILTRSKDLGKELRILIAERSAEWLQVHHPDNLRIDLEVSLDRLSGREADSLLRILEETSCLGHLRDIDPSQRKEMLLRPYGANRDLLVAIYSATYGRPLEDVVVDDFRQVDDEVARLIFLSVAVLHRMKIQMRAGTLFRITGLNIDRYRERYVNPLSGRVFEDVDRYGDISYRTRHPLLADILFRRVLEDEDNRMHHLLVCAEKLDPSFQTDSLAFRNLIQHDAVRELLPTPAVAARFYDALIDNVIDNPYVPHQAAVYELSRKNGDLERASVLIMEATRRGQDIPAIKHTEANLLARKGALAKSELEQNAYFKEAEKLANALHKSSPSAYTYHTLAIVACERLKKAQKQFDIPSNVIEDYISRAGNYVEEGLARYPDSDGLLTVSANLYELLGQHEASVNALVEATRLNPGRVGAVLALSGHYRKIGKAEQAFELLEKCHLAKPNNAYIGYLVAETLSEKEGTEQMEKVRVLLEDAINRDPLLLKARILLCKTYLMLGLRADSRTVLKKIPEAQRSMGRSWRLFPWRGRQTATVSSIDAYVGAMVTIDGLEDVYMYLGDLPRSLRDQITIGMRLEVQIFFNSRGPVAVVQGQA